MLFRSLLLALTLTSVLAYEPINPDPKSLQPGDIADYPIPPEVPQTNAKRLADGLPLLKPKFKRSVPGRRSHTPTPVELERRTTPSQAPSGRAPKVRGFIIVKDASNGKQLGYISKNFNIFGEYGVVRTQDQALYVVFEAEYDHTTFDVYCKNQSKDYRFIGGVVGSAPGITGDLKKGSSFYTILGGVRNPTPRYSPPTNVPNSFTAYTGVSKKAESPLWKYAFDTKELSPVWTNNDRSQPAITSLYREQDNVLLLTADVGVFTAKFGPAKTVKFQFVPI